ncbi:hypothetical protein QJS10_CPB04g00974 [Acorus calamus]|uniref:Uncharacterized protein n=1 Tax=Acorus calamus TaxID=4465 RepID=A0AAV9F0W0_ACOCL|nr:hypothetical protein QJS10_CPB04g00974 [Acorus calamus]
MLHLLPMRPPHLSGFNVVDGAKSSDRAKANGLAFDRQLLSFRGWHRLRGIHVEEDEGCPLQPLASRVMIHLQSPRNLRWCNFKFYDPILIHYNPYDPGIISIGPYHRGKTHLQKMEEYKWRFLHLLLSNDNGDNSLQRSLKET